jgi:microcystin-dependent protein
MPIGYIVEVQRGYEAPDTWIPCDGRFLLKEDYPKLYSVIKDNYGSGEYTFTLPDLNTHGNYIIYSGPKQPKFSFEF